MNPLPQIDDCRDPIVCRCLGVTESELQAALVSLDIRTLRELRQHTGAGDGCTCCHDEIRKQLQMVNSLAVAG